MQQNGTRVWPYQLSGSKADARVPCELLCRRKEFGGEYVNEMGRLTSSTFWQAQPGSIFQADSKPLEVGDIQHFANRVEL